jgi:hypothetical protein
MTDARDRDTEAYLARIRRTIEESNRLVEQVGLRIRETDRMLEQQGLTREQVMAMRFSDAQIEAANEELKRRGMDPLEQWEAGGAAAQEASVPAPDPADAAGGDELAERQRKFGMMMKPFQI